ncbi:class I SAM-dependent methyltransferase [Clostridium uliginosum]|uniref:Methyltransferase domain-containing protein n=1 Tax=Clostridium uliginosum TaxID=119641 RepID=A0A1I1R4A8_9CLOT|nr:class I SAM-dependent methyltransferase [Clostridium uliginosum]SFD26403.1 Methyltransferase domain-containing protein [Clostridium uliginosum]
MRNLTIRYGKIKINPCARNLLRVVCLLANFKVDFLKDYDAFVLSDEMKNIYFPILKDNKSNHLFDNEGLVSIETEAEFENIVGRKDVYDFDILYYICKYCCDEKTDMFIKNLWLLFKIILYTFESKSKFEDITYEKFSEIIDDILKYSNSYIKDKVQFKNKNIEKLWDKEYSYLSKFEIVGDGEINSVNQSETQEYRRLFDISKTGVESIDNAVETLINILPEDAEKILDIGSGPGYVNRNIPPCYNVLAMDIDENILKDNIRKWCIGDILNITLKDKSVEMIMACDVLEHIEKDSLKKAIFELERVSSKYIYIQVPFGEYLGESMALCNECGNKWHVNYHKNSFDYNKVIQLLSDEWKIKTVAFTGEVSEYEGFKNSGVILDTLNIEHHEVENWKCPVCGGNTVKVNSEYLDIANEIAKTYLTKEATFVYSEIAVLFERKNSIEIGDQSIENIEKFKTVKLNTADIKLNDICVLDKMKDYIKNVNIPCFIAKDFNVDFTESGMKLEKIVDGNGIISFVLPVSFSEVEKTIRFTGSTSSKVGFVICGIDLYGKEYKILDYNTEGSEFNFDLVLNNNIRSAYGYLKIYADGNFQLSYIKVLNDLGMNYVRYIPKSSITHLCKKIDNINFMWFVPKKGYIDLPDDLMSWLNQSSEKLINGKFIFDYIKIIYERIFNLTDIVEQKKQLLSNIYDDTLKNDNFNSENKEILKTEEIVSNKKKSQETSTDFVQMSEIYKQSVLANEALKDKINAKDYYISTLSEKLALSSNKIDELEAQINLYKANLSIMNINTKQTGSKIKTILAKATLKALKLLKKIVKIPIVYDFLVDIGAKKVYNRIKTKIKGDNKYE